MNRTHDSAARRKAGVTLIELVLVLAVMGIILSIGIAGAVGSLAGLEEKNCRSSRSAISHCYVMHQKLTGSDEALADVLALYAATHTVFEEPIEPCPAGGVYHTDGTQVLCTAHP